MCQGRRGKTRWLFRFGCFLIFAALVFFLFSPQTFLLLENDETHLPLFWIGVKGNEAFSLAFRHSYDKDMYIEHYKISGGKTIYLVGLTFKSDLNGQGFIFPNANYFSSNGWGTLEGLRKKMASVSFIMGSPDEANHFLMIGHRKYFLTQYVSPGTPVAFKVVKARKISVLAWRVKKWMN